MGDCPAILVNDECHDGIRSRLIDYLETASGRGESEKTSKIHHGCSSLEQNNDKESSGEG